MSFYPELDQLNFDQLKSKWFSEPLEDRDVNAAQVNLIWARGQELASLDAESASSTDCGSMRQLAARKRQKRAAQRSGCA